MLNIRCRPLMRRLIIIPREHNVKHKMLRLFYKKMKMYPNVSQVFDIDMFMYSFQDMTFSISNYKLLYILIGKVLINESLILHYHKKKK